MQVLRRRGVTETGGILMGEHVAEGEFRIVDFTVQHAAGTFGSFLRLPQKHLRSLRSFLNRTGNDYRRFNYLGEWHSHPAFSVRPSASDIIAMRTLVDDPTTGATFAILMIVRLEGRTLQAGTYVFIPGNVTVMVVPLILDTKHSSGGGGGIDLVSNPDLENRDLDSVRKSL